VRDGFEFIYFFYDLSVLGGVFVGVTFFDEDGFGVGMGRVELSKGVLVSCDLVDEGRRGIHISI